MGASVAADITLLPIQGNTGEILVDQRSGPRSVVLSIVGMVEAEVRKHHPALTVQTLDRMAAAPRVAAIARVIDDSTTDVRPRHIQVLHGVQDGSMATDTHVMHGSTSWLKLSRIGRAS